MADQKQVDNLVDMLDGYVQKGGHHLNVNVFTRETLSYSAGSRFSKLPSQIPFNAKEFKATWEKAIEEELNENPDGFTTDKKAVDRYRGEKIELHRIRKRK